MTRPTIKDIRNYTDRKKSVDWLLSEADKTFTLVGNNLDGTPNTGEINVSTDFDSTKNILKVEELKRFFLILYCLRNIPYFFKDVSQSLSYNTNGKLFLPALEKFLQDYQTSSINNTYSRTLTADIVRTYRKKKNTFGTSNDDISINKDIQKLIDFANTNKDYKINVTGVLGKVTYSSIVKHTLYSSLVKNGIIKKEYAKGGNSWSEAAAKLGPEEFGFFIDVGGGTYSRAFPVVCVFIKSAKKSEELQASSNEFISSKFSRSVTVKQLVLPIELGNEKNIVTLPNRNSGDFLYCFLYDLAEVMVLEPKTDGGITLDLLKISLSFFSTRYQKFNNKNEFLEYLKGMRAFVAGNFSSIEDKNFSVLFKNKHSKECDYFMNKSAGSFLQTLQASFKAEVNLVLESLEQNYSTIVTLFDKETKPSETQNFQFKDYPKGKEYPITLHFDNFYNLLSVTTENAFPSPTKITYEENIPFNMEDYAADIKIGDLTWEFFAVGKDLPVIPNGSISPDYSFTPSVAMTQDLVLITDEFLRLTYENLDSTGKGFVYETSGNQEKDEVLKADSINLIKLIKERTGKVIEKVAHFIYSPNKINLQNNVVEKLKMESLNFPFGSVGIDKIKFQTINHLLFLNMIELAKNKGNLTIDGFKSLIYYPVLNENSASPDPAPPGPPGPPKPPAIPAIPGLPKPPAEKKNLLINNIISSELHCYEDILSGFDKAINAGTLQDKIYYAFQTIVNIGLPILLAMAAKAIADKLSELSKIGDPLHPTVLECLALNKDNLKKTILGYADLISNLDNPKELLGLLSQGRLELPKIPAIVFLTTFDAEKEIKRRLLKFVIDLVLELVSQKIQAALKSILDMCNADSYLTSFLSESFSGKQSAGAKGGTSSASGLPSGNSSTIYSPTILVNINDLIDNSKIATKETVYEIFRGKFRKKFDGLNSIQFKDMKLIKNDTYFINSEISSFFDYISSAVDAGELASLLKGTYSSEGRMTLLSYIKNYSDESFYTIFYSNSAISSLFEFLSLYIDYTLCYGVIKQSLINYSADICSDINSKFSDNILSFGSKSEKMIEDEIADLHNSLDELCKLKNSPVIDFFSGGPSLLTKGLSKAMVDSFNTVADSVKSAQNGISSGITLKSGENSVPTIISLNDIIGKDTDIKDPLDKDFGKVRYITIFWQAYAGKTEENDPNLIFNGKNIISQLIGAILDINKNGKFLDMSKENYNNDLKNVGNIGLKTELFPISGYITKYNEIIALGLISLGQDE